MHFVHILTKLRCLHVKNICKCALRNYLSKSFAQARKDAHLTQAKFSEYFMMDTRSYADLEHAHSLCCTLTFIIYLCFFCKDVNALIQDLRNIILDARQDDRFVS